MSPRPALTVKRTPRTLTPPDEGEGGRTSVRVRKARLADVPELLRISHAIYGDRGSWKAQELRLHQEVFPDGQFVAEAVETGRVIGMAVSLVVSADEWPLEVPWRVITDNGRLTTHTESGDTLYAAGVAVDPAARGLGVGSALYRGREALTLELGLDRIRAGARIPGYGPLADRMSPEAYVEEVVRGLRKDPTLSFQLAKGFQVLGVAPGYLRTDRESRGYAAVVEWRAPG
ncbi:MAG: GNAT family N-acetyltransferase [Gemmatimonadales bacterium]|nr:MAG: GNAT family N-acetyltransferase [Gemmatimonadales bacterium]